MGLIRCSHLGKRFGREWVFRNIEIELSAGEVLCVVGSNGSGKSTLLRCLAGLISPTLGSVERPARLGYAALDLALWPHLTAMEHLRLAAKLRGLPAPKIEELVVVGLEDAADKQVGQFSTGMRARLKVALATQHEPDVLILDEPTASLDLEGRNIVVRAVEAQQERGSVIIATNDPADRRLASCELELG